MEKQGYVYILTNPSFKEDWVKIGMSAVSVEQRVKQLVKQNIDCFGITVISV